MTTLLLTRHGESEANRDGFFAGQTDVELLSKGIEQAEKTGEYIAENYKIDKVYASDLKRAYKTGEIIAALSNAEIFPEKGLREIYAGKWQQKKFEELVEEYKEGYSVWLNDIGCCTTPDGESVKELSGRVLKALTKIANDNEGKTIAIATHATPIRAVQCLIEYSDLDRMKDVPWVSNASVTELAYSEGRWELVKAGRDEHLSSLKTTFPANV